MSWRDRFQEGSFRGAAFKVTESRSQFGRRNQVHEYPGRDVPWAEDLGRAARKWSIECEVVGDDYDQDRDALIAALEGKGPGTLVHPYLGTIQAVLESPAQVTDSTAAGGVATFSLQFAESGADTSPAATPDTQAKATAATAALQTAAASSATDNLDVADQPAFVVAGAQGVLGDASAEIGTALAAVQPLATGLPDALGLVSGLVSNGLALLTSPLDLVDQLFSAVNAVFEQATFADDALTQLAGPQGVGSTGFGTLGGLMGFGSAEPAVPTGTPTRAIQTRNQAVLCQLVQVAAAAAAVNTVADMDFTSYDDAVGIRDPLADQLDTLAVSIADSGDDQLARAVDDVRLAMVADVTARGASLARLFQYTPQTTEPALVIAQRLYGDGSRADDIIARNPTIQNPGFVPAGMALEVISDA